MTINRYWADQIRPRKRPFASIEDEDHHGNQGYTQSLAEPLDSAAFDDVENSIKTQRKPLFASIEGEDCHVSESSAQFPGTTTDGITSTAMNRTYHKDEDYPRKWNKEYLISSSSDRNALILPLGSMCQRCQSIDLDTIFSCEAYEGRGSRIIGLGKLRRWSQTCTLCRQLRKDALLLPQRVREVTGLGQQLANMDAYACTWELRRYSIQHLDVAEPRRRRKSTLKHWPTVVLCPGNWTRFQRETGLSYLTICPQMILPTSRSSAKIPGAAFDGSSRIVRSKVDFVLARTWLERCNNEHSCSIKSLVDVLHLDRVIDCQTRKLVLWSRQEYVALSYVWGTRSRVTIEEDIETRTSRQLPSQVPRTINDAITATLEIGKRFLWVDRYCVDQFHSEQKAHQIKAMADIYEQATVTIVALSKDADIGLYGVSLTRPVDQIVLQSSTGTYVSTLPTLQRCFEDSVYKRRAWTYQEAALSKRCLIFAPSQVYFTCRSHTVCESLPLPFARKSESAQSWHACLRNPTALPWSRSIRAADSYQEKIEWLNSSIREFLLREMTYEADALNAFRGTLARTGLVTLYGLPIQHLASHLDTSQGHFQSEFGFLQSLLWIQDRTTQLSLLSRYGITRLSDLEKSEESPGRKRGMPTWSWVSCKSHDIDILGHTVLCAKYAKVCYSSAIFIKDGTGHIQVAPYKVACDSSTVSEAISLLTFEDPYTIRRIDPKPLTRHFHSIISAQHLTFSFLQPAWKHFKTINGMPILILETRNGPLWLSRRELVWIHIDREAGPEMAAIAAGQATLDAILLEVRSDKNLILKDGLQHSTEEYAYNRHDDYPNLLYNFLLVCQRNSQPATRVGVLRLSLNTCEQWVNSKVFSRDSVTLA